MYSIFVVFNDSIKSRVPYYLVDIGPLPKYLQPHGHSNYPAGVV